jgi:DNA-binding transcriptional ArsR family regulator
MESNTAIKRLAALAQESRLGVFRLLVKAGPDGLPAGEVARSLDITPNTLSAQFTVLLNAGLVQSRRDGRSIIYTVDYAAMSELLVFLTEDCCQGRSEICTQLAEVTSRLACCSPTQEIRHEASTRSRRRR